MNRDDHPSRAELSADAYEEGIQAARAVAISKGIGSGWEAGRSLTVDMIDAFLEAMNAH